MRRNWDSQWNASNDPATVGYVIDYGAQSGKYTHQVDVGNALSLTLGAAKPAPPTTSSSGRITRPACAVAIGRTGRNRDDAGHPTITSLTIISQVAPPRPVNTAVQWTATAVGGVAPYQYRWFVFDGENWWKIGSWTATATVAWQPTVANGGYVFGVWARSAGSNADAPEMSVLQPFSIAPPVPPASVALSSADPTLISAVADAPIAGVETSPVGPRP